MLSYIYIIAHHIYIIVYIYMYTSIYVNHLEIEIVMICHDEPVDGFLGGPELARGPLVKP